MIKFILHRPRNPKNIGASARGMANFGFRDLAVVAPYAKAWRETRSAVNASPVVEKAKKFKTLKEAIKSSHVVIGTSAGSRRNQEGQWIGPEELRAIVDECVKARRRVAIVFGPEKSGLSNEDLGFCRFIIKIPTDEECPSMNLGQAVAVVAYALRQTKAAPNAAWKPEPIASAHVERLVDRALVAFTRAGLLKGWDARRSEQRIRKAFIRWNMTEVDLAMLHGIFRWVIKTGAPAKSR